MARDFMPRGRMNRDSGSIPGFKSGYYRNSYGSGKILWPNNDIHTHLHKHPGGLTISTFPKNGGRPKRFNFRTGRGY